MFMNDKNLWFPEGPFQDWHKDYIEKKTKNKYKNYYDALMSIREISDPKCAKLKK